MVVSLGKDGEIGASDSPRFRPVNGAGRRRGMIAAAAEEAGFSAKRWSRIGTVWQRYVDENKLAGLIAMVARCGDVVYLERFGMMDLEAAKPMQFDTIFRIYSMTKPIASVALPRSAAPPATASCAVA
jgi:CubicO group peptidase (beta-lactamase class C family)